MRSTTLALGVLTLSCTPPGAARSAVHPESVRRAEVWLAPALGVSGADIDAALARPFERSVPVQSPAEPPVQATIGNCHDYQMLRPQGYYPVAEDMSATLLREGVRCLALGKVAAMKPALGEPASALIGTPNVLELLPPTLGPAASPHMIDQRRAAAARGASWRAFQPEAISGVRGGVLTVKEPNSVAELTPLASGDLDGDGLPELLLQSYGYGTEGNWLDVRLAVLSAAQDGRTGALRVLEIVDP